MKIAIRHRVIEKIPVLEVVKEEQKEDALPLIVYYHGWQTAKELSLTQARKLAKKGFRVVLPDAMYHGERKNGPLSAIPSLSFFSSIQYNIIEFSLLIRYFERLGLILEQRIGIGGVSMGGMTTCALLTQHPEIKVAVCLMGTAYLQRYVERVMTKADEMRMFIPRDLPLLLSWVKQYDLSQTCEKLANRPMLFWHGTEDQKIPYKDMKDFEKLLSDKKYTDNVTFLTGKNEGHLVTGETMDVVADFFDSHL